jgi:hypothetical protein
MSQENVEAVRRVYEQMARGNFWAAREIFDPAIAWEWSSSLSGLTGVGTYHGLEGVEVATRSASISFKNFRRGRRPHGSARESTDDRARARSRHERHRHARHPLPESPPPCARRRPC